MPNTNPGQVDDDAKERAKKNKKKKEKMLQDLFDNNTDGRYGKGTDE